MKMSLGRTLKPYALVFLLTLCAGSTSASFAQVIESVTVGKDVEFVQTSPVAVQVNPEPPSPTFGGPYGFGADVDGQNISSISAPRVSGPIFIPEPSNNGGTLLYNGTEGGWRYGFPNANDWGVLSLSDLNSSFGSGVYTVTVNGTSVALNLAGDAYPNNPVLTLSGGVWSNGKYVMDASQSLVITTNAFSAYGTHPEDLIGISVDGVADALQMHSTTPQTNFLTFTVPAFSFISGQEYNGGAFFAALVDVNPNAALPGSLNAAFYAVSTTFAISAVPEPSIYVLALAGIGLLGFVTRRRLS